MGVVLWPTQAAACCSKLTFPYLWHPREFNKAEIPILLGDTQAELHPPGLIQTASDADDIQLDAMNAGRGVNVNGVGQSYLAVADKATNDPNSIIPRVLPGTTTTWPLVKGWLRVEYLDKNTGKYVNGIMNAVELDLGNLRKWLLGSFGANGPPPQATSEMNQERLL
jgi:hypothetical protein